MPGRMLTCFPNKKILIEVFNLLDSDVFDVLSLTCEFGLSIVYLMLYAVYLKLKDQVADFL